MTCSTDVKTGGSCGYDHTCRNHRLLGDAERERDEARAHARDHHIEKGCLTCIATESERNEAESAWHSGTQQLEDARRRVAELEAALGVAAGSVADAIAKKLEQEVSDLRAHVGRFATLLVRYLDWHEQNTVADCRVEEWQDCKIAEDARNILASTPGSSGEAWRMAEEALEKALKWNAREGWRENFTPSWVEDANKALKLMRGKR